MTDEEKQQLLLRMLDEIKCACGPCLKAVAAVLADSVIGDWDRAAVKEARLAHHQTGCRHHRYQSHN